MYIHVYVVKKDRRALPLIIICNWPHVNSCIWAHDVRLHVAGTNEPKSTENVQQVAGSSQELRQCNETM